MAYVAIGAVLIAVFAVGVYFLYPREPPPLPSMKDGWFGKGSDAKPDDTTIYSYQVNVSEDILDDLKVRLGRTRLSEDLEESTFEYGMQTKVLGTVLDYWQHKYDWRKHEKILNSFAQFETQIEGVHVHFLHVKSQNKAAKPLLLVHGWPGSVWEFYKLIPMLTDPINHGGSAQDAFHVVAPSIPGYGFSEEPSHRGFDQVAAARVFHKLMVRLGYSKYNAQGGDWGAVITTIMSQAYPSHVQGLHFNMGPLPMSAKMIFLQWLCSVWPSMMTEPEEAKICCKPVGETFMHLLQETGYYHLQSTKPDTVGVGLNDSPAGLAAYILEKFSGWTSRENTMTVDGGLTKAFTLDELLTNVMIYWVNGNIKASTRLYKEFYRGQTNAFTLHPVNVPSALAVFPQEISRVPRFLVSMKYKKLLQYNIMPRGGHFAAFQEPELLVEDMRVFFRKL